MASTGLPLSENAARVLAERFTLASNLAAGEAVDAASVALDLCSDLLPLVGVEVPDVPDPDPYSDETRALEARLYPKG